VLSRVISVNELIIGKWPLGRIDVLYISPLKALNNDIRSNLIRPLSELKAVFKDSTGGGGAG